MTAREAFTVLEGKAAARRAAHDDLMEAAWLSARLTAYAPEKAERFIKLEKLLTRKATRPPKQSWRAQEEILSGW